jgi:UDP-N-acetylglucosamine diphosphorylase / glucose-1-phosphate thymidylyltransferase / UDP-N-acetylgalactosamine diphosphorylase / glucosamine-1-phosphate N-acetyltransferase / galactosamine-1-phosphate N-acetyltransferase
MPDDLSIADYIESWKDSPFADTHLAPWQVVAQADVIISTAQRILGPEYRIANGFAIHASATIETGAVLKGVGIIEPRCFVAAGAYLRGGVYLGGDCIVGPSSELKSSFLFPGSKLAHFNFVGDSILGSGVNVEAGAVIANYRNELAEKTIRIAIDDEVIDTGVVKFGALVGDRSRVGANAVVAPGTLIAPETIIGRLQLIDQYPQT